MFDGVPVSLRGGCQGTDGDATDSFVPTVTAISTSPGLSWMVQPAVVTSVPASSGRPRTRSTGASQTSLPAAATKAKSSNRKGLKEKVRHGETDSGGHFKT